jgi:ribosomal protein S18 acetylase RimI-like enzyme
MLRAGMFAAPLAVDWAVLRRLSVVEIYTTRLHRRHAPRAHWYLSQIGVEPARQGQGLGSALLGPMLARMDGENVPCYLETSKAANVAFYQKYGFAVVADGDAVAGGPHVWAMLRAPG